MSIGDINKMTNISEKHISEWVNTLPEFKEQTQKIITERIIKAKGKAVSKYNLQGELIATYNTITEAAKSMGFGYDQTTAIIACCKSHQKTAYGFIWRYKDDLPPEKNKHYGRRKAVKQYDMNGNFIKEYPSASYAARITGISQYLISAVARGEQKSTKGFVWAYI